MNGAPWPREVRDFRVAVTSREREVFGPAARELRRWMLAHDPHQTNALQTVLTDIDGV